MSFPGAFIGLIVSPGETTELLLNTERPRHGLAILIMFYLVILVPVLLQAASSGLLLYRPEALAAIVIVPTLTVLLFVLLEAIFLRVLNIRISLPKLASSICYSLVPLIGIFLGMYIINYLASGSIAYLTIVLNGYAAQDVEYKAVVPWVVTVGIVSSFLVFFHALRAFTDMYATNAFIVTALSTVPLLGAFLAAVSTADLLLGGTSQIFQEILMTPASILGV